MIYDFRVIPKVHGTPWEIPLERHPFPAPKESLWGRDLWGGKSKCTLGKSKNGFGKSKHALEKAKHAFGKVKHTLGKTKYALGKAKHATSPVKYG